jgi:hypothetical protein
MTGSTLVRKGAYCEIVRVHGGDTVSILFARNRDMVG